MSSRAESRGCRNKWLSVAVMKVSTPLNLTALSPWAELIGCFTPLRPLEQNALFGKLCKMLVKMWDGLYALQVVPYPKMFVGGVDGITIEAKAH